MKKEFCTVVALHFLLQLAFCKIPDFSFRGTDVVLEGNVEIESDTLLDIRDWHVRIEGS